MTTRHASCSCGSLRVRCEGDPVRVSICHCTSCQQRTGSVFGAQSRFPIERVTFEGPSTTYVRVADSGNRATFHFCPTCGSTVHWTNDGYPGVVAVAIGAFGDAGAFPPTFVVYEDRRPAWLPPLTDPTVEHMG